MREVLHSSARPPPRKSDFGTVLRISLSMWVMKSASMPSQADLSAGSGSPAPALGVATVRGGAAAPRFRFGGKSGTGIR